MAETAETCASGVQVGLDTKAILEAWTAIQKKHPELPVFIVTFDTGTIISICYVNSNCMRLLSQPAHLNMLLHYLLLKFPDSANCQACVFHLCSQEFRLRQSSIRGKFHSLFQGRARHWHGLGCPAACASSSAQESG